jgi:hypothetical protein
MASPAVLPKEMLPTDSSAIITINSLPEYSMVRTGVQGRGSCYLHALFTDISGKDFRQLSIAQRDDIIHKYRRAIAQKITLDEYIHMLDGQLAYLEVFELLEPKWNRLYNSFSDEIKSKYPKPYNLLGDINRHFKNLINVDANIATLDPILRKNVSEIIKYGLRKSFENFKERLANPREYIDQYFMNFIDRQLNVNVIFISTNGNLYSTSRQDCDEMLAKGQNFVLVYYLDELHYEAVGRVNPDGTITSYFQGTDPMIKQLLKLCI